MRCQHLCYSKWLSLSHQLFTIVPWDPYLGMVVTQYDIITTKGKILGM